MRILTGLVIISTAASLVGCQAASRLPLARKATKAVGMDRVFENDQEQLASAHAKREIATHITPEKKPFWKRFTGGGSNPEPRIVRNDPVRLDTKSEVGVEVHLGAAGLHEQRGDLAAAASSYARALEADPKHEVALISFARLYDRHSRFEEAEQLYQRAIDAHPSSSRAHNDYGLCLVRQGRAPEGLKELAQAVELSPTEPRYRNNIAHVLTGEGRIEDALEHLRTVYNEPESHYNVAHWLESSGNTDAALSHYVRASHLDPNFQEAHSMVAQLQQSIAKRNGIQGQTPYVSQLPGQ